MENQESIKVKNIITYILKYQKKIEPIKILELTTYSYLFPAN
jgi:hypothetical protein